MTQAPQALQAGTVLQNKQFQTRILVRAVDGMTITTHDGEKVQWDSSKWQVVDADKSYLKYLAHEFARLREDYFRTVEQNRTLTTQAANHLDPQRAEVGQAARIDDTMQLIIEVDADNLLKVRTTTGWHEITAKTTRKICTPDEIINMMAQSAKPADDDTSKDDALAAKEIELGKLKLQLAEAEKAAKKWELRATNNQNEKVEASQYEAQIRELNDVIARQRHHLERKNSRLNDMMNPTARIRQQNTPIQCVTLSDRADVAPQDVKIAQLLSDGWQIANVSYVPTHIPNDDGVMSTFTTRYTMMIRERVEEPASPMEAAIEAALNRPYDGSHIAMLTAPIEMVADAGYATTTPIRNAIEQHGKDKAIGALDALVHEAGLKAVQQ